MIVSSCIKVPAARIGFGPMNIFIIKLVALWEICMKKSLIITGIVFVVSLIALMIFVRLTNSSNEENFTEAKQGYFEIAIEATGELIAENSIDVRGPNVMGNRRLRASPLKIIDLVPEGTEVRKGDFIASLDKSSFSNTLKDEQQELDTHQNEYDMKVLDTAVVLSELRDQIRNQYFATEEARITLEQSKFEPPATQRQAEISLDKSQRMLEQQKRVYALKKEQLKAEIMNLKLQVNTQKRVVDDLDSILKSFTVTAPADGMVIYKKDRLGVKVTTGTSLNPFEPVVATLPDLSSLLSKIYISEIDINKIRDSMPVEVKIDAFTGKVFRGKVNSIANIGEQLPNSDTKVFEVMVKLNDFDPQLRPSMTTSNKVIVKTFDNVIYIPNESVHAGVDSIPFVYTRDGKKQVVVLGESNDKEVIVENGLEPGRHIWLTLPDKPEKFSIAGDELIPVIKEKQKNSAIREAERRRNGSKEFASVPE
jgi:multidrug efflux pump subunit AcrA (membrane-fusion protein)